MNQFNTTCIAWINANGCTTKMAHDFALLCQVFLVVTCVVGILLPIATLRRIYYLRESKSSLFIVVALQLMAWAPLQLVYLSLRAFSINSVNTHPSVMIVLNLLSSMLLGNTIPRLIISWIEISQKKFIFQTGVYQKQYWLAIVVFTLLVVIFAGLSGVKPSYYFVWMRVTLGVCAFYLSMCCLMLFWFGIKMYRQLDQSHCMINPMSDTSAKMVDPQNQRARSYIL